MNYRQREVQRIINRMWKDEFIIRGFCKVGNTRTVAFEIQNSKGDKKIVSYNQLVKKIRKYYL